MRAIEAEALDLLAAGRETAALARRLMGMRAGSELEEAIARAARQRVDVVVFGQFKRGKTTLINALVGRDLLPRAAIPATSVITRVRRGPQPRTEVTFAGGARREIALAEIPEYVTEQGNPGNARAVRVVDIEVDGPLVPGGLTLVDTPGTGSVYRHNTDVARGFLPGADAALFVVSADPPLSAEELEDLAAVRAVVPLVICALNKIDQVEPGERSAVLRFTQEQLSAAGHGDLPVAAVSGREALEARLQADPPRLLRSGIVELERLIEERVGRRTRAVARESVRRRTLRALDAVEAALGLQRRVAELGDAETGARLERFRDMARQIQISLDEDMLATCVRSGRALREQIEPWLAARAAQTAADLAKQLEERDRRGAPAGSQELERWLSAEVERAVGEWVTGARRQLAETIDPILRESADRANQLRDRALAAAVALFDLSPPPPGAAADGVVADTAGLLRLDDQATGGLELATVALRRRLPGRAGHRAALRGARGRASDLIDRHSGRLRSALAEAIDDACRTLARRREAALQESLQLVGRAVDAASEGSARSIKERGENAGETEQVLARVAVLRAALTAGWTADAHGGHEGA